MLVEFSKMNGAGNDFVMFDNRDQLLELTSGQISRICDRHRGVGADGVLVVEPPKGSANFRMRYYNADGGEAEMCGNGARCFARYAMRLLDRPAESISFETLAGTITAVCLDGCVRINMSEPHSYRPPARLQINGRILPVSLINTGVPHAVVFVDDLDKVSIDTDGAAIRNHKAFAPRGANANFASVSAPAQLAVRTYERGVEGETLACGTGVVACALVHHLEAGAAPPVHVRVRGGETLAVDFETAGENAFSSVTLTGPADFVFDGTISL